ncbi:MAG: hypothetical protein AAFY65_18270 [Pseudomonadota bacterium]
MMRVTLLCGLLVGCATLPDTGSTAQTPARANADPVLIPLDTVLAEAARPSRAQAAEGAMQSRAAGLARRGIPAPGTGDLAERGRKLRERAEALRAIPL